MSLGDPFAKEPTCEANEESKQRVRGIHGEQLRDGWGGRKWHHTSARFGFVYGGRSTTDGFVPR